jgi:hypothetical protein
LHVIENTYLPIVGDLFKIACALVNAFSPPLSKLKPEDKEVARVMLERRDMPNLMQAQMDEERWDGARTLWNKVEDSSIPDFPIFFTD